MKNLLILTLAVCSLTLTSHAFCGFYVAKADAKLFNESSQVIIARDGDRSTITMSNDFKGEVKDFAMVVPVPVVLKESDIRTSKSSLFEKMDAYSGPRLVEYHDQNPCNTIYDLAPRSKNALASTTGGIMLEMDEMAEEEYSVTIEAEYAIGEYDILILSAKESDGLQRWLTDNGYKIPDNAQEVLTPYIKSGMRFFVAKVNLKAYEKQGYSALTPLQISFNSDKFMLPIRLGMANAKGTQDLIVYLLTKKGRVETANYRNIKVPTNNEIPTFVEPDFGQFYADLFKKAHQKNQNGVFQEYAWNLDSENFTKCDPCNTTPPNLEELTAAGASWLRKRDDNNRWAGSDYTGDLFFTRLHVRYDRKNFPQDLAFIETADRNNFQGRYVMRHPAQGDLKCNEAQTYLRRLVERRKKELTNLNELTGSDVSDMDAYWKDYEDLIKEPKFKYKSPNKKDEFKGAFEWIAVLIMLLLVGAQGMNKRLRLR